jgi:hypothetical protein
MIDNITDNITDNKNKSFNIKDLVDIENLVNYSDETDKPIKSNRDELRAKLRSKTNSLRNNRMSKNIKEENQMKSLKENPMFKDIDPNSVDMKNIIENMSNKMCADPKQKKNIKKQMEKLVEKMKDTTL